MEALENNGLNKFELRGNSQIDNEIRKRDVAILEATALNNPQNVETTTFSPIHNKIGLSKNGVPDKCEYKEAD